MRLRSITFAFILLLPPLLLSTSNLVTAMHSETLANEVKEPPSEHPQVQAVCQLKFTLKGWSAVYKTVRGSGTLTCDNGQKAKVKLQAKGGGLTAARSAVRDGLGKFSKVTDIGELFGTYVGPPSGGVMIMKKGEVALALTGKGTGFDSGISFGEFTVTKISSH